MSMRLSALLLLTALCPAAFADDFPTYCNPSSPPPGLTVAFVTTTSTPNAVTAITSAGPTSVICLAAGAYSFSAKLSVPDGAIVIGPALDGSGRPSTITLTFSSTNAVSLGNGSKLENVSIVGVIPTDTYASTTKYAVSMANVHDASVTAVDASHVVTPVEVSDAQDIAMTGITGENNGHYSDGIADADVWINTASSVSLSDSSFTDSTQGPAGDGGVEVFNSVDFVSDNFTDLNIGSGAFYLVACRGCQVLNSYINDTKEWSFEIDCASDDVLVDSNTFQNVAGLGYIDQRELVAVEFSNNYVVNQLNTWPAGSGACYALNWTGSDSGATDYTNNTNFNVCTTGRPDDPSDTPHPCPTLPGTPTQPAIKPQENTAIEAASVIIAY
jgi:hypothetical protein